MKRPIAAIVIVSAVAIASLITADSPHATAVSTPTYDISTLAGKVASVHGTAGLNIRMSAFIEQEADTSSNAVLAADGATLSADSTGVQAPNVTVNQDTNGAPQNETSIAVDPGNPSRVVGSANDYVSRTWSCSVSGTPCSALGDGYSGTYYSNDGGKSWCCVATDQSQLGTLIPGVTRLAGGSYDAGGDPAVAFDSRGNVYYAGLGFNRATPPNTVAVNKGTFSESGALTWSAPTFINPTTSRAVFNDKEWVAADASATSPYRDRVYVSWTRFIFNPTNGRYVQSPISIAYSADGGKTFSSPQLIAGNVLYGQGSRPVVGPDGTVYVFWDGSTRLAQYDSIWMVKSTNGGASWSKPVAVAPLADIPPLVNTQFRVNSYPAAAVGPTGALYVTWTSQMLDGTTTYSQKSFCAASLGCTAPSHSEAYYSMSADGGATWSTPLSSLGAPTQKAVGYPIAQPDGSSLAAPAARPTDSVYPSVSVAPSGRVYLSAYQADIVSPWQSCATYDPNGSVNCLQPGPYVNNAKLDYVVTDLTTGATQTLSRTPINTRYNFRGQFIGDYTQIAAGSDGVIHAMWTDTNNKQSINWWYGYNFGGLLANQQDVVTSAAAF